MKINPMSVRTRLRRLVLAALSAVAVVAIAGCAQIPMNSAILDGPNVQNGLSNDYLYYSPSGPADGQDQKAVLSGFLNAATGPQNDYSVAREFLIPKLRTTWSPNQEVLIQQGSLDIQIAGDNTATVKLGVSAKIDADGHYLAQPSNTKRTLKFTLVKTSGNWRISSAPDVVVMIRPVFDVIFHSYATYYFDHTFSYLVPDLRWFPSRASTATRLVTAVLNGPSAWLKPAVQTPMPVGTRLAIDAVTIDGTTAVVNLNSAALQATAAEKQYFKAQLTATLTQLSGVTRVEIQIDRALQKIATYIPSQGAAVGYAPVALVDGSLTQLASPAGTQITGSKDLIRQVGATDFAVTSDNNTMALQGPGGTYRVKFIGATQTPIAVDVRKGLLAPVFDSRGMLWSMTSDGGQTIQVMPESGAVMWFSVSWMTKYRILDFALSAEGSRIAFVAVDKNKVTKVFVASVIRDSLGVPTGLGQPLEVAGATGTPVSVAWSGATGLVGLSSLGGGQSSVDMLALGAEPKNLATLADSTKVLTADGGNSMFVLTKNGSLLQNHGFNWSVLADRVTAAHMPY